MYNTQFAYDLYIIDSSLVTTATIRQQQIK